MSVKEAGDKISIVSAVSEDGELFFAIKYESMRDLDIITFLEQLLFEIRGFICVFWDNITIHHGENVKEFPFDHNDRMITRRIPAYSPEFNPDEWIWNALKYQELPNFCPASKEELLHRAEETLLKMKGDPERIKKIIMGTKLPLPSLVNSQVDKEVQRFKLSNRGFIIVSGNESAVYFTSPALYYSRQLSCSCETSRLS